MKMYILSVRCPYARLGVCLRLAASQALPPVQFVLSHILYISNVIFSMIFRIGTQVPLFIRYLLFLYRWLGLLYLFHNTHMSINIRILDIFLLYFFLLIIIMIIIIFMCVIYIFVIDSFYSRFVHCTIYTSTFDVCIKKYR